MRRVLDNTIEKDEGLIDIERGSILAHFADICYMVFSSILFVKTSLLGLAMLIISEFTSSFVKVHYLRDSFEFDIRNCHTSR
eukprot:UN03982